LSEKEHKCTYFYLYVILDVFSRYVVGWIVAPRESAELAKKLIEETCEKQNSHQANSVFMPTAVRPCFSNPWPCCSPT
jgi:transposase InsO family protein